MDSRLPQTNGASGLSRHPFFRSVPGLIGLVVLFALVVLCIGSVPWTFARSSPDQNAPARYKDGSLDAFLIPPSWAPMTQDERARFEDFDSTPTRSSAAAGDADSITSGVPGDAEPSGNALTFVFGTDKLGRDLFIRCLAGGAVSIGIGLAAAFVSVVIGTLYGAAAGFLGGRADALMMRIVDILYGLPYVLLVVLLAVAGDAWISDFSSRRPQKTDWIEQETRQIMTGEGINANDIDVARFLLENPETRNELEERADQTFPPRNLPEGKRKLFEVMVLLLAIGGVSWLTMARVIRGQVLSLKEQPFLEAARAIGVPARKQFTRHLFPNLLGPIIVYATLTVPQAILQESFLSFLGIGVQPPLPSWGNLAAEGLSELNPVRVRWWLIAFPCALLALTLLSLNFVGEGMREAFDPKRRRR